MENPEQKEDLEIDIVPAKEEDMLSMAEVFYKSWLVTYPNEEFGITVDDIEDKFKDAFTEEALAKRWEKTEKNKNQKTLLAKEGGRVVGLIRITFSPDKNQLQALYLLPQYQGKGIGTKLWEEAKTLLDPAKDIIVQVATYNTNAINFYERLGFVDGGKRFEDEKSRMKSGSNIPQMEMERKAEI